MSKPMVNNFINISNEYIDPNSSVKKYPTVDDNKRNNVNSFMERSLQTFGFINDNNSKQSWFQEDITHVDNNIGLTTRNSRKLENTDNNLHLQRSMLQPDFRHGNRFYEFKPVDTRRENFRGIGNENIRKFQNQTGELYQDMTLSKAYDTLYRVNRN